MGSNLLSGSSLPMDGGGREKAPCFGGLEFGVNFSVSSLSFPCLTNFVSGCAWLIVGAMPSVNCKMGVSGDTGVVNCAVPAHCLGYCPLRSAQLPTAAQRGWHRAVGACSMHLVVEGWVKAPVCSPSFIYHTQCWYSEDCVEDSGLVGAKQAPALPLQQNSRPQRVTASVPLRKAQPGFDLLPSLLSPDSGTLQAGPGAITGEMERRSFLDSASVEHSCCRMKSLQRCFWDLRIHCRCSPPILGSQTLGGVQEASPVEWNGMEWMGGEKGKIKALSSFVLR